MKKTAIIKQCDICHSEVPNFMALAVRRKFDSIFSSKTSEIDMCYNCFIKYRDMTHKIFKTPIVQLTEEEWRI